MNKLFDDLAAEIIDTLPDGDWFIPDEFIQQFGEAIIRNTAAFLDARKVSCRCYDDVGDDAGDDIRKVWQVDCKG